MKTAEKNELLSGNLKTNLIKLALPTSIGYALPSLYDMVHIYWIRRISASTVA